MNVDDSDGNALYRTLSGYMKNLKSSIDETSETMKSIYDKSTFLERKFDSPRMSPKVSTPVVPKEEDNHLKEELKIVKENFLEVETALYILTSQSYEKMVEMENKSNGKITTLKNQLDNEKIENEKLRSQNIALRLQIEQMMKVMENTASEMEKEHNDVKNFALQLHEENKTLKEMLSYQLLDVPEKKEENLLNE
eukprot:gene7232-11547_t